MDHDTSTRTHVRTLTERVLGFEWQTIDLGDDVVAIAHDRARALGFVERNYAQIFGTTKATARFLVEPLGDAKRRFTEEMDVHVLLQREEALGVAMGHLTDWSTYYWRTLAFLPEKQSHGVGRRFIQRVCDQLRDAGVRRVEAECLPTNAAIQHCLAAAGFVATGAVASERWGFLLRMTKFLDEEAKAAFLDLYSPMTHSRRTP